MFAQITTIRVPLGQMSRMRVTVGHDYLPAVRARAGFVAAYWMEQADDPEYAELVVLWESQEAVESFAATGMLESSVQALAAAMPGARVQREGFLVKAYALGVGVGAAV